MNKYNSFETTLSLQIVGSRGKIEMTPRAIMTNEVAITGINMYKFTEVYLHYFQLYSLEAKVYLP